MNQTRTPTEPPGGTSRIEQARTYQRLKRIMGFVEFWVAFSYLIFLLVSGWTFELGSWTRQLGGGPVVQVLIYFGIAGLGFELVSFPVAAISGYFLEKKYGLSLQTPGNWLLDLLKGQILGLGLGAILVEILYLCLKWCGDWWWWPAGASWALVFIVMAELAPVLVLPWFYSFKPLSDPELTRRLNALCRKVKTRVLGVYEWGLSRKTTRANAALMGWGPTRRVVLSDSLLEHFTPSEIEVVLAHELGHQELGHFRTSILLRIGAAFGVFYAADFLFFSLGPLVGLGRIDDVAGMPLLAVSFMIAGLVVTPLVHLVSRKMEFQADLFAISLTGLAGSFVSALERLALMNLAEMDPHPVIEFLFHSHPSPTRRIRAVKEYWQTLKRAENEVH